MCVCVYTCIFDAYSVGGFYSNLASLCSSQPTQQYLAVCSCQGRSSNCQCPHISASHLYHGRSVCVIPTVRSQVLRGQEPHLKEVSIPRTRGRQPVMGTESFCQLLSREHLTAGWSRWNVVATSDLQSKGGPGAGGQFSRPWLLGKGAPLL